MQMNLKFIKLEIMPYRIKNRSGNLFFLCIKALNIGGAWSLCPLGTGHPYHDVFKSKCLHIPLHVCYIPHSSTFLASVLTKWPVQNSKLIFSIAAVYKSWIQVVSAFVLEQPLYLFFIQYERPSFSAVRSNRSDYRFIYLVF